MMVFFVFIKKPHGLDSKSYSEKAQKRKKGRSTAIPNLKKILRYPVLRS